jgi:hypothetical protein
MAKPKRQDETNLSAAQSFGPSDDGRRRPGRGRRASTWPAAPTSMAPTRPRRDGSEVGRDRLRLLVGPELREKFDRQRYLLNQAIWHGELEAVRRESGAWSCAWQALDRAAAAAGKAPLAPTGLGSRRLRTARLPRSCPRRAGAAVVGEGRQVSRVHARGDRHGCCRTTRISPRRSWCFRGRRSRGSPIGRGSAEGGQRHGFADRWRSDWFLRWSA